MNKVKRNIIISILLIVLAITFTILVKTVDVKATGLNNTDLGFSAINHWFSNKIGVHMKWYKITDLLGYVALLFSGFYAFVGVIELVKRKSVLKVDKEILLIGAFYVAVIMVYIFFEKFIINYRPVLIDGELEASYPSSHTLLSLCICGSSIIASKKVFKQKPAKYMNIIALILMISIIIGRILSGVHWFTDIMGGIIISLALLMTFYTVLNIVSKR